MAVHFAYPQEFDDASAAFVKKRFQAQQALAKAQGAPASDLLPSPAQADPAPPAATLVRPGVKSQLANSTAEAVAISVRKAVGTPWAFAMRDEVTKRTQRVSGMSKSAQFQAAKKMLVDAMGGA